MRFRVIATLRFYAVAVYLILIGCAHVFGAQPGDESQLVEQATWCIRAGDNVQAKCLLRSTISRRTTLHEGRRLAKQIATRMLSEDDITFGREQVRLMLRDRPAMAEYVVIDDQIYNWCARQFACGACGYRTNWSNAELVGTKALHIPATIISPGVFRLASTKTERGITKKRRFEDLWASAIFEFHNLANDAAFGELDEKVLRGVIRRDEYIEANFCLECQASHATQEFFLSTFFDHMQSHQIEANPTHWYFHEAYFCSPQESLRYFWNRDAYPWATYGKGFDLLVDFREMNEGKE